MDVDTVGFLLLARGLAGASWCSSPTRDARPRAGGSNSGGVGQRGAAAERLDLRLDDSAVTARTDAVAELCVGMCGQVVFDLGPVIVIVADALAVTANGQQTLQLLDVDQRLLQVADAVGEVLLQAEQ